MFHISSSPNFIFIINYNKVTICCLFTTNLTNLTKTIHHKYGVKLLYILVQTAIYQSLSILQSEQEYIIILHHIYDEFFC